MSVKKLGCAAGGAEKKYVLRLEGVSLVLGLREDWGGDFELVTQSALSCFS